MKLEGKEKMVYEVVRAEYKDEAEFVQEVEWNDWCVKVSCEQYDELVKFADHIEKDELWEMEEAIFGRISVVCDPYEDWDAEEI